MSEQYRVPGDEMGGNWPEWTGEGVPPEPYLKRETRLVTEREKHPSYTLGSPAVVVHVLEPGQTKVIWKLYGDHWLSILGQPATRVTEFQSFTPDGLPEVAA